MTKCIKNDDFVVKMTQKRNPHFACNYVDTYYYDLFADKYDSYYEYANEEYESEMKEYRKEQETTLLFYDGMPN